MKKIIILMPVYNDWESLTKLLQTIDLTIKDFKNYSFECLVINDSSILKQPVLKKPISFNTFSIIDMKKNCGHARCIATGLRYINLNKNYDYVIIMDSDGEDRPCEMVDLINKIGKEPKISVVAKRIKRSEGFVFQSLYQIHKFITFFFTGKNINFGNYSCLTKKDSFKISNDASLWSSFSGTLKKNIQDLNEIDSIRGQRYYGPSKMSIFNLIIHSFSIIGVFKYYVFLRSAILVLILMMLSNFVGIFGNVLMIILIIFNLAIFAVSLREKKRLLTQSEKNIANINEIIH
tara:strand:+ start:3843 stop:4715 length:873 start_codon:yes stop_codon:yes gene_type:complete